MSDLRGFGNLGGLLKIIYTGAKQQFLKGGK